MQNLFPITLVDAFMISPKVKHFIFKTDLSPAFNYLPGQFITIHFNKNDKKLKRSYSLANPPLQDNQIEFAAGYAEGGPGTELLFNLKPRETIYINGPFGRLILKNDQPRRYLFVGTSTGITPYRAMLPELKKHLLEDHSLHILIMLGVQTREEALYAQDFLSFAAEFPNRVSFRVQLSRAKNETLLPHEYRGYVQHAFPDLMLNPLEDRVYLCGNPAMIDEAFENLKTRGFTLQQIIREKYISAL